MIKTSSLRRLLDLPCLALPCLVSPCYITNSLIIHYCLNIVQDFSDFFSMPYRPHYHYKSCTIRSRVPLGPSAPVSFVLYHATAAKWAQKGVRTLTDASRFFNEARQAAREGHLGRRHIAACFSIFAHSLPIKYRGLFRLHMRGTLFPILDNHPKHLCSIFKAIKETFPIDSKLSDSPLITHTHILDSEEEAGSPYQVEPQALQPPDTGSGSFSYKSIPLGYTDSPATFLRSKTHSDSLTNCIELLLLRLHAYLAKTNISIDSGGSTMDLAARSIDCHRQPSATSRSFNNPLSDETTCMMVTPTPLNTTKIMRSWPWDETLDFLDPTLPAASRFDFITAESDCALGTDSKSDWNELVKLTKKIYEFSSIVCAMDVNGRFIHAWVTENDCIHSLMRSITIHRHLANFTLSDRVNNLRNIASQLEMYAAVAKHENDRTGSTQVTLLPSETIPTSR